MLIYTQKDKLSAACTVTISRMIRPSPCRVAEPHRPGGERCMRRLRGRHRAIQPYLHNGSRGWPVLVPLGKPGMGGQIDTTWVSMPWYRRWPRKRRGLHHRHHPRRPLAHWCAHWPVDVPFCPGHRQRELLNGPRPRRLVLPHISLGVGTGLRHTLSMRKGKRS